MLFGEGIELLIQNALGQSQSARHQRRPPPSSRSSCSTRAFLEVARPHTCRIQTLWTIARTVLKLFLCDFYALTKGQVRRNRIEVAL